MHAGGQEEHRQAAARLCAMRTVVCVHLAHDAGTRKVNRSAPMIIRDVNSEWREAVEPAPELLERIQPHEDLVYFEAEVDETGELAIGERVPPPHSELH